MASHDMALLHIPEVQLHMSSMRTAVDATPAMMGRDTITGVDIVHALGSHRECADETVLAAAQAYRIRDMPKRIVLR